MNQMKKTIYTLIGIAIMLLGFFVPEGAVITQTGMRVLFIFIGTLFLWTAVGGPWVSVLSITMIGFSGYTETFGAAFTKALGDENYFNDDVYVCLVCRRLSGVRLYAVCDALGFDS